MMTASPFLIISFGETEGGVCVVEIDVEAGVGAEVTEGIEICVRCLCLSFEVQHKSPANAIGALGACPLQSKPRTTFANYWNSLLIVPVVSKGLHSTNFPVGGSTVFGSASGQGVLG
jgi:hypothetical protein